jgi:hypothetical protein
MSAPRSPCPIELSRCADRLREPGTYGLNIDRRERLHLYRSIPVAADLFRSLQAKQPEGGLPVVELSIMVQTY